MSFRGIEMIRGKYKIRHRGSGISRLPRGAGPALIASVVTGLTLTSQTAPAGRMNLVPTKPGTCVFTRIKEVTTRLSDGRRPIPDSGSAVILANGVYGVSYDTVPEVQRARAGDRVMACLVRLPQDCPPGDHRGKLYTTTDLRTEESWTLPDAEHSCGGA